MLAFPILVEHDRIKLGKILGCFPPDLDWVCGGGGSSSTAPQRMALKVLRDYYSSEGDAAAGAASLAQQPEDPEVHSKATRPPARDLASWRAARRRACTSQGARA